MSALTDLQAALASLNNSVSGEISEVTTAIQNAVASSGAVAAADAEAIVGQLNQTKATLDAETAALTGTIAPPPGSPSSVA